MKDFYRAQMEKALYHNKVVYAYWVGRIWEKPAQQAYNDAKAGATCTQGNDLLDYLLAAL